MAKRFNIWFQDEELEILKKKAKKQNRSVANLIKTKCFGRDVKW